VKIAELSKGVELGGRFRLIRPIGHGSYGSVWLAEVLNDPELPAQIALKVYHHPERATKALLEEANIALGFSHDRLVKVFGAKRLEGLVVMWMEYVSGQTLLDRLGPEDDPRPVSSEDVLAWLRDISDGLAYLHSMEPPRVHGDLKLDNVLLDPNLGARLVDFGQSRAIEDRFVETRGGGALPYLAPELLGKSSQGVGKRYVASDIYSFGVIAYRFLTGRFPRRTIHEIVHAVPFPRPGELNPSIPPSLESLVWKCLQKRPADRYANGVELLAAIETIGRELAAEPSTQPQVVRVSVTTPTPRVPDQLEALIHDLLKDGKAEEAVARLEKAVQRMSTSPRILLLYASAARTVGKPMTAHLVYQRALAWLRREDRPDEDIRDAMEGRGELDVELKRYEDAVEAFQWLSERWPAKRWYHYKYAVALGLAGRYRRSLEVLQELHEAGPASATICSKIGLAYVQLHDIDQALQYFGEALMLDEYEPHALFQRARIRWLRGKQSRAFTDLDRLSTIEGAEDLAEELSRVLGRKD
jgi:eukaryotic-like serine/threonine-protein kinase